MNNNWDQAKIQDYIDDGVEESLTLDYKAAGSLGKSDGKKKETTKDVSAMANSAGGIIMYGVKEFNDRNMRHLPEKFDGVDRTEFSKEWLEQVFNNVRPRIPGLVIHPVNLNSAPTHVVYVVEIPQSTTAHQATDWRYYKRFNFQSIPMEDYEIRDVMNRATTPEVSIKFGLFLGEIGSEPEITEYRGLRVIIRNDGTQVVNRFKVVMTLTNVGWHDDGDFHEEMIDHGADEDGTLKCSSYGQADRSVDYTIAYQPDEVLFPKEEIDMGTKIKWGYPDYRDPSIDEVKRWYESAESSRWSIEWKLYADNMPFKQGVVRVCDLPIIQ